MAANSPEYRMMLKKGPELRNAFQPVLLALSERLVAKGLISVDNQAEINNVNQPLPNRAAKLVALISNQVLLDPAANYQRFLEVLKQDEQQFGGIIFILNAGGVVHSQSSNASGGGPSKETHHETPKYFGDDFVDTIKKSKEMTREQEKTLKERKFHETDIVIIAAVNENEIRAIRHFMEPLEAYNIPTLLKHHTYSSMMLGTIGGCNAVLVQTEMGPTRCQEDIKKALDEFPKAKAVIAIGVAFGASRDKYKLCDVLVSKQIFGYGTERLNEDGTVDVRDPILMQESKFQEELVKAFTRHKDNWERMECTQEGRRASVHIGNIVSTSLLVDSVKARDALNQKDSKMIGGEMEGYGLLQIQREYKEREIGVMVVKGISDFADGVKDKHWQLTAAMAAASYVEKMISENQRLLKPQEFAAEQ